MNKAYSVFNLKAFDDDQRTLTGLATTPATDRYGDIVEPDGAEFDLPIPLLWQHDSSQPIGQVTAATVRRDGIEVEATIAKTETPGNLQDRLNEAWESIKIRLVRGLSIGFSDIESEPIGDGWARRFTKWQWLELSTVTIPANAEASIQTIKRYDDARAAPGQRSGVVTLDQQTIRRVRRLSSGVVYLD